MTEMLRTASAAARTQENRVTSRDARQGTCICRSFGPCKTERFNLGSHQVLLMSEHPFTQIGSAEPNIPDDPFVDPSYEPADFVVVANRLPLRHAGTPGDDGWLPSPGGLVSALTSVLQSRKGLWIGWPGTSEDQEPPSTYEGIRLKTVAISAESTRSSTSDSPTPLSGRSITTRFVRRRSTARGGTPTASEYALRDHRGRERRTRRHCVGARLSAPTGPADVARASPGRPHRILFAHPVPPERTVHATAVAT